jgi:hypothetical protein
MNASTPELHHGPEYQRAGAEPGAAPAIATNGRTIGYGAFAILGGIIFPPLGIVYAYRGFREPKKTHGARSFSLVAAAFVTVCVIADSLLFAGGLLPFTRWVIRH